jgi:hypothetical protein
MERISAYITVHGTPLCDYTATIAGIIAVERAVPGEHIKCGHRSIRQATIAARKLSRTIADVRVVRGTCPLY